jgi:hypothetical protein
MPEAGTWNRSIKGYALKLFVAAGGEDFELGLNADAEGCLEEQTLKRKTRAINVKGQESASTASFACVSELDCRCHCPLKGQEQRQISGILEEWALNLDAGMTMETGDQKRSGFRVVVEGGWTMDTN